MNSPDLQAAHEALYARIPSFTCKEGCTECCGPRPLFSPWELSRITERQDQYFCRFKGPKGCTNYEHRSLTCRLYGTVEGFECPYAGPEKLLTRDEARKIKTEYFRLFMTAIKSKEAKHGKEADRKAG